IKDKVSYIVWKFEPTENEKLHAQMYLQFHSTKRQTLKSAKEIFKEDKSLIFQEKLGGTSIQNRDYLLKTYDRSWGRGTLPKEVVGPFEFGEFREIEKSFTKAYREKKDIKELKLEEHQGGLDSNKMLEEEKTPLEIFRENKNKILYCKSYETMIKIYNDLQKEKQKEK
ncbi:35920_t:CDS:2, partial [Racocetra persica]